MSHGCFTEQIAIFARNVQDQLVVAYSWQMKLASYKYVRQFAIDVDEWSCAAGFELLRVGELARRREARGHRLHGDVPRARNQGPRLRW